MHLLRHLRPTLAAVILLTAFFVQSQTVFACELLGGSLRTVCCCGEEVASGCTQGGGCESPTASDAADCCDVSLDVPGSVAAAVSVTANPVAMLLDRPQPSPATLSAPLALRDPSGDRRSIPGHHASPDWLAGSDIYLLTSRFRS